ncbi:MAG: sigma-70 family RNA polymerase sigma factor [Saprospiraceae bacterium]|nr:sigma-70 family RNA polymerase sigma factor [Saprospiraceae bacterium]
MSTVDFKARFLEEEKILFGLAMKITRNVEDAKDLLQETAIRAFKNRHKFQVGTNFKAWMATIMKNVFINGYRKKKRRPSFDLPVEDLFVVNDRTVIRNAAPSNLMMEELQSNLDSLPADYRKPFTMYFEGYRYEEISDAMDIPLGTVKSRIYYARQRLRDQVRGEYRS